LLTRPTLIATVAVIHGPAGAGKGELIASVMKEEDRLVFRALPHYANAS
jgi:guanylate kinase